MVTTLPKQTPVFGGCEMVSGLLSLVYLSCLSSTSTYSVAVGYAGTLAIPCAIACARAWH